MKILFSHRFFWPDTAPYASFLRVIAGHVAAQGHEVQVYAGRPSYNATQVSSPAKEMVDGIAVTRGPVIRDEKRATLYRLVNVLLYCAGLLRHILRERPDVVTASTFPPVVAGLTAAIGARITGARFVYHLQDIHPEVSEISGGVLGRAPIRQILRWLDTWTLRRAAAIVTLSEDMAETLRQRDAAIADRIWIINNLSLDAEGAEAAPEPSDRFRVIFAGNLGRYQDLGLVAAGIGQLFDDHPRLELMFLGSGAMERELKETWGDHPQVRFHPFVPFAEARQFLQGSDLGIVSIIPGLTRVAYPSKLITYQSLGLPVLALVDAGSHLAAGIRNAGSGIVVETRTAAAVAQAVRAAMADEDLRQNATQQASQHRADHVLSQWDQLVEALR